MSNSIQHDKPLPVGWAWRYQVTEDEATKQMAAGALLHAAINENSPTLCAQDTDFIPDGDTLVLLLNVVEEKFQKDDVNCPGCRSWLHA
jgi:hypothetical protein